MAWLDERIKINPEAGPYPLGMGPKEILGEGFGRGFAALHQAMTDQPDTVVKTVPTPEARAAMEQKPEPPVDATTRAVEPQVTTQQAALSDKTMPVKGMPPTGSESQATKPAAPMESGLPSDSQVDYLKQSVSNRISGTGDKLTGLSDPPPEPPATKQFTKQLEDWGTQVAFDQSKVPNWHESDSFSYAMINFGLNLLSGNDLATSFSRAGQTFTDMYGREKREAWAQDLAQHGYSGPEIQQYIETGDSKVLTDPMERQAKLQQFNLQQAQLEQALQETSPEAIAYKAKRQAWEDRQEAQDKEFDRSLRLQQLDLDRQQVQIQREAAKARADAAATKTGTAKLSEADKKNLDLYTQGRVTGQTFKQLIDAGQIAYPNPQNPLHMAVVEYTLSGKDPVKLAGLRATSDELDKIARSVEQTKGTMAARLYGNTGAQISSTEWVNELNNMPRANDSPAIRQQKETAMTVRQLSIHPEYRQILPQLQKDIKSAKQDPVTGEYLVQLRDGRIIAF